MDKQEAAAFLSAAGSGDVAYLKQWLDMHKNDAVYVEKFLNNISDRNEMYATHKAAEFGCVECKSCASR